MCQNNKQNIQNDSLNLDNVVDSDFMLYAENDDFMLYNNPIDANDLIKAFV